MSTILLHIVARVTAVLPALLLAAAPIFLAAAPLPAPAAELGCCRSEVCCCAANAESDTAECRCHVSDSRGEVVIPLDGEPSRTGQSDLSPLVLLQGQAGAETTPAQPAVETSRAGVAPAFPVYLRHCSLLI